MKRHLWLLIGGLVALAGLAAWWVLRPGADTVAIDLVNEFSAAKKQPSAEVFSVIDAKIGTTTKRAIFAADPGRITWHVTVPNDAWLKVSLGLKEEGWTIPGDGVYFSVGVSEGAHYDPLVNLVVNPYGVPSDRGWHDLMLDLSQYAGTGVDIIFNNRSSPPAEPGKPGRDDRNGDFALWGDPRVVVR
jgi:hypothetical protein